MKVMRHFLNVKLWYVMSGSSLHSDWLGATIDYDRMKDTLDKYRYIVLLF